MNVEAYIGREVSSAGEGRRRRRGYVMQTADAGRLVVGFYPEEGRPFDVEIEVAASEVRLLKAGVPSGWRAIDVANPDGSPYMSLRFRPYVVEAVSDYARQHQLSFEQAFNQILHEQLEKLIEAGIPAGTQS